MSEIMTDKCVFCGEDTGIPTDTPINKRKHYVVGCGQLCRICSARIKFEHNAEQDMSKEELEHLLNITKLD